MIGINVRAPYAHMIISGRKTIETRSTNSLKPYIGQRVGIVETGSGKAKLVGYATIGMPTVMLETAFREAESLHIVSVGSEFDIAPDGEKYCYPIIDAHGCRPKTLASRGIIARQI